jgi:hypothetical protein
MKCLNIPGPIGILTGWTISNHHIESDSPLDESKYQLHDGIIQTAGSILLRYCPKASDNEIVSYGKQFNLHKKISCQRYTDKEIDKYRIN